VTGDWERVSGLFGAARLLDDTGRRAFLEVACGADPALRREIDALLAADVVDDGFLDPVVRVTLTDTPSPRALLSPGQVLKDRYEIEGPHGAGGQSVVYRAIDRLLTRHVVIKVMRGDPAHHSRLRARFEDEMRALSRVEHPAVVGILDVGALHDGAPFLVIQYIDGVSVRELLRGGSPDRERIIRIVRTIGAALSAVHAAGIAHHDLKPENIMVQRLADGTEAVKLIDLGMATVDRADLPSDVTTVMIAGSVRYMAPEQFEGRNSKAADIYSFGLVACELLCGHPDVRALPRRISPRVRRLLEHAVAYAPEARPRDAKAWADALAKQLARAGMFSVLIAATIAALVFAAIGLVRFVREEPSQSGLNAYHFTPFATEAEPKTGGVWSRDGHSVAYNERIAGVWQLFVRSVGAAAPVQLTSLRTDVHSIFWWPDGSRPALCRTATSGPSGWQDDRPRSFRETGSSRRISRRTETRLRCGASITGTALRPAACGWHRRPLLRRVHTARPLKSPAD